MCGVMLLAVCYLNYSLQLQVLERKLSMGCRSPDLVYLVFAIP